MNLTTTRIITYAVSLVSLALLASASLTMTVVALDANNPILVASLFHRTPPLPKPTPDCPDCRDASSTLANVKETP